MTWFGQVAVRRLGADVFTIPPCIVDCWTKWFQLRNSYPVAEQRRTEGTSIYLFGKALEGFT